MRRDRLEPEFETDSTRERHQKARKANGAAKQGSQIRTELTRVPAAASRAARERRPRSSSTFD